MSKTVQIFFIFYSSFIFTSCSHLYYYPSEHTYFDPAKAGFEYEDIYFPTADGEKLHAWFFKASIDSFKHQKPKGTIIQFHGNAENLTSHFLSLVWLVDKGYNLLAFDYRGYGTSSGKNKTNQKGTYEDALAALRKGQEYNLKTGGKLLVAYGQSLGGVILLNALKDSEVRDKIDLVVADSTFLSYQDVAQEKLASVWLFWPFSPLGQILISDRYAASKTISDIKPLLLVIHDIRDPVVSFENGLEIFKSAKCEKEMWTLDKGRHVGVFSRDTLSWRDKFVEKLENIKK